MAFVCVDVFVPVNNISVMSGRFSVILGSPSIKQRMKCLLKDTA